MAETITLEVVLHFSDDYDESMNYLKKQMVRALNQIDDFDDIEINVINTERTK